MFILRVKSIGRPVGLCLLCTLLTAAVVAAPLDPVPAVAADPAFDRYAPPGPFRDALARLDVSGLIDAAAGLAEGERILLRPRHDGVTADGLLLFTVRLAAERRDGPGLERLEKLLRARGAAELAEAARLARAATRGGRPAAPALTIALDQISPEDFAVLRSLLAQIEGAKALGDRDTLEKLELQARAQTDLDARCREYLARVAGAAKAAAPPKVDPSQAPLKAALKESQSGSAKSTAPIRGQPTEKPAEDGAETPAPATVKKPVVSEDSGPAPTSLPLVAAALAKDPTALDDPGFEGRIDLGRIGTAWAKGDPSALTDLALRMAEEERILQRAHNRVPAQLLFQGAIGLAVANNDAKTLDRLERALKDRPGREDLLVRLDASRRLVGPSRRGRPYFMASVDQVTPEAFASFRMLLDEVQTARAAQDAGRLDGLMAGLSAVIELDDAQREYVRQMAAEARREVPEASDAGLDVLRQLAAQTRGAGQPDLNRRVLAFASERAGRLVGDGRPAALVEQALQAAGASRPASGSTVWGRSVGLAEVRPGDIALLDGVELTVTGPDGRSRGVKYPQQAAVVSASNGGRRFVLLLQKAGPSGTIGGQPLVQLVTVNLDHLKSGRLVFYRPVAK